MNEANSEFLTCVKSNDCDHETCIHKERHKLIDTRDPHQPNCVKGAYCYYRNIPIHCVENLIRTAIGLL